uniref:Uncharacterized protein n=1 Tax=Magallana gigas TaxID=29159 RepID=K1QYN0_MAGGI
MDYRISSYRLIMDSTRSILNSDSSCGSPPLDSGLEDVFEELADGLDYPRVDARHEMVHDLLKSEREYGKRLRSILDTYAEPLRKFSSLTPEDHRVLFVGVEPILSIKQNLLVDN